MRRSKLEMHVNVLRVLAKRGPLQLAHIMNEANLNGDILKEFLAFLVKQGLIEEVAVEKNNIVYANTDRGKAVVRFFGESDKTLSVTEEGNFLPVPY
jgi:predicted transcriptional regulator